MFFELRVYPIQPGKADEFVRYMDETIIPFQLSKGMTILGAFINDAGDAYVWIRRFANQAEKEALYDAVYKSAFWRDEVNPRIPELIDRDGIEVTILQATPRSFMR